MSVRNCLLGLLISMASAMAYADTPPAPPPPPQGVWYGSGQAGFVAAQGNTRSKSANAALDMALLDGLWKHSLHFGGLYGQSSGITSAQRWDALGQSNYEITKELYAFGALRYARDQFSGFHYQGSLTGGLGYKIIDTATTKLSAQVGAGYRRSQPELLVKNASGAVVSRTLLPTKGNAIATAGVDYSQVLSASTTVTNKFLVETGSDDTLFTDALALNVKMSNRLALSLGYALQNNTKPPAGLKKLDTVETMNLVYAF